MYSILGLFSGLLTFKYAATRPILRQHLSYGQFGLPLQVFNHKCHFIPIFNLSELDLFEKYSGFVAGTTNQLFLNYPKARADIVINIDKNIVI